MFVIGLGILYFSLSVIAYKKILSEINNNDFAYIEKYSDKFWFITFCIRIFLCFLLLQSNRIFQDKTQFFSEYFFYGACVIDALILFYHFYLIIKVKKRIKLLYGKTNCNSIKLRHGKGMILDHVIVFFFIFLSMAPFLMV